MPLKGNLGNVCEEAEEGKEGKRLLRHLKTFIYSEIKWFNLFELSFHSAGGWEGGRCKWFR